MHFAEPHATATLLTTFAVLLAGSVLFGRAFEKMGVPVVLAFLAIGVLAGYHTIGNLQFEDYHFAFRVGLIALVLILFDGGLNTPTAAFRRVAAPALTLATVGVALTAALVSAAAHLFGMSWPQALLLGAVVSSTDAAAVFSVLRSSGVQLEHRVASTLEVESGINDPVAMILTIAMTQGILGVGASPAALAGAMIFELLGGALIGYGVAVSGRMLLTRFRPPSGGLVAVVTLALALLTFGIATLLHASGLVAVYAAGITLGNGNMPMRASVIRFHDAFGWLAQITMFLLLGLLAHPLRVAAQVPNGLLIGLALTFIARPLAALLCLLPFGFGVRAAGYVGWVGLRGAVPIVLAIFPVLSGAPDALVIFDVVFVIVIVNALIPGSTVRWATRLFKLEIEAAPRPTAVLQIEAAQPLDAELRSFYISPWLAVAGATLSDVPFPEGAAVSMIVRGESLIPPKGNTLLQPGDHVYVIAKPEDVEEIQLLFGKAES